MGEQRTLKDKDEMKTKRQWMLGEGNEAEKRRELNRICEMESNTKEAAALLLCSRLLKLKTN